MTNANLSYHGQCLCGSIKYQIDALEPNIGHCHCSMCRKFHGAAFATYGKAKSKNFHLYTDFKASWYDINDDLLKYHEDRD